MSCKPPQTIRRNYRPSDPAAAGVTAKATICVVPDDGFVAIEIGGRSDIDAVVLGTPQGDRVCAVGSPVIGPFGGIVEVKPLHVIPFEAGVPAYLGHNLTANRGAPIVELVCHRAVPAAWSKKRGPSKWRNVGVATTASTLLRLLEVPFYGRKRCTFAIRNGVAATTTWSIRGCRYENNTVGAESSGEVQSLGGIDQINTQLVLDGAGSLTTTLTTAAQVKFFTVVDEAYDTLWVEVTDDGTPRTLSAYATVEDE